MKRLMRIAIILQSVIISHYGLAGQNNAAGIRIDFNYTQSGNQGVNSTIPQTIGTVIWLEIHAVNTSNLDTYEFDLHFNNAELVLNAAYEDNPFSGENNLLKKNGGSTIGFGATNTGDQINVRNTLVGNQGDNSPDGTGLLALLKFTTIATASGSFTFTSGKWYDNNGVLDNCSDIGDASLPVEVYTFNAKRHLNKVVITWSTQSEINNYGFFIYRSLTKDGIYRKIHSAIIKGASNTTVIYNYTYTDEHLNTNETYYYKLEQLDYNGKSTFYGPIDVSILGSEMIPQQYVLEQNYPNPFNPLTTIKFSLKKSGSTMLVLFNTQGELVKTLVRGDLSAGYHAVTWDGRSDQGHSLPSGLYFYKLAVNQFVDIKKMILSR